MFRRIKNLWKLGLFDIDENSISAINDQQRFHFGKGVVSLEQIKSVLGIKKPAIIINDNPLDIFPDDQSN